MGSLTDASERAAQALGNLASEHTRTALKHAESGSQALTLFLASPEFMRR
jgi:uncharacterized protein (DUF1800 family)